MLIANATSLELQITGTILQPFAVSDFKSHSLLSTIGVVENIVSGKSIFSSQRNIVADASQRSSSHRWAK